MERLGRAGMLNLQPAGQMWPTEPWNLACGTCYELGNLGVGEQWKFKLLPSLLPKSQVWCGRLEPDHNPPCAWPDQGWTVSHFYRWLDWGWAAPLLPVETGHTPSLCVAGWGLGHAPSPCRARSGPGYDPAPSPLPLPDCAKSSFSAWLDRDQAAPPHPPSTQPNKALPGARLGPLPGSGPWRDRTLPIWPCTQKGWAQLS